MSRLLELPNALCAALQKAAEASGSTPVSWIAAHLREANRWPLFGSMPTFRTWTIATG